MKLSPTIDFKEFDYYTTQTHEVNGFHEATRQHPDFGTWQERSLNLKHIRIFEHQADLLRPVNVHYEETGSANAMHHCISLKGDMSAHFIDNKLSAKLTSQTYHQLFVPENDYLLRFGSGFMNVHIEIDREHFVSLLCDSESWSADLRKKLLDDELFYPGEHALTPDMLRTIYEIFNSPLSGSLKRLLIEARVHELVALQLNQQFHAATPTTKKSVDLFYDIRNYLAENFLKEHTLKEIARNFGINEFALKKGFRENFQTTVFDFLLSKRMEHAREQLLNTGLTVQAISTQVGYKYPNHFSAAFKKKFGVSPASIKR